MKYLTLNSTAIRAIFDGVIPGILDLINAQLQDAGKSDLHVKVVR